MLVIFVHGWSVTDTSTYGDLPKWLAQQADAQGLDLQVGHIYLGRYVSFVDTVTLDDVARAFDQALADTLPNGGKGQRFACITHSTGGPVLRKWMDLYYRERLGCCPLSHLVMLAPANHGSSLAQLGKERLSRIKSFFQGVQPGMRILDWLELGSDQSWELNESWLSYDCVSAGIFPFVLTGQKIDRQFYDAQLVHGRARLRWRGASGRRQHELHAASPRAGRRVAPHPAPAALGKDGTRRVAPVARTAARRSASCAV